MKKKLLIAIPIVLVAAVILFIAGSMLFYDGPTSMMPAKWTDAILTQANTVDFAAYKTVTVSGNLNGKEITAVYNVSLSDDKGVFTCVESSGEEAALKELNDKIMPKALLTFTCGTDIADGISAGAYPDAICMLQKYTFEIWWGDEEKGNATSELYTWGENLALQTYAVTTRPDAAPVSTLTFAWN